MVVVTGAQGGRVLCERTWHGLPTQPPLGWACSCTAPKVGLPNLPPILIRCDNGCSVE